MQYLFYIIEEYSSEEETKKFINDNIQYTFFRDVLIDKYYEEKNFDKVIEIALEGEKQDSNYRGLVLKWKKIRYSAYKEAGLIKEQEKLAKELVFEGQFEYYKELKRLSKKEDFYNNFKKELKSTVPFKLNVYTKLIEEENDLEEIMELIRKNILKIEEYAEMLVDTFKDEVIEIYESFIKSVANASSNRNNYKEVCRKIKEYKKIAGKKKQEDIIIYLIDLYKRRPAFIDELSKIK